MAKPLKVLVSGDVEGKFDQLFTRVSTVQKKAGNFDLLFCVGDFFGKDNSQWQDYVSGSKKVPISTYVLGPSRKENVKYFPDIDGCELCGNVTYLGRKGMFTGASGLQVAYLGGTDGTTNETGDKATNFHSNDVDALRLPLVNNSEFKGVDILLTSQWPSGVEKYGSSVEGFNSADSGSAVVSQLAIALRPRYHFSGREDVHYERQPYRNHQVLQDAARHVTRFISLAKVGNTQKKKYLYAFNVTPLRTIDEADLVKQPPDVTECPYRLDMSVMKSKEPQEKSAQFFYDQGVLDNKGPMGRGRGRGGGPGKRHYQGGLDGDPPQKRQGQQSQSPCWFCLGSPEVEKHLVVSVGNQTYLALAKGGLTPDHVLITPIGHHQSLAAAPPEVIDDIRQYQVALKKFFRKMGKVTVFFERNYKTQHMQIQAVPLPGDCSEEIKETFIGHALSQDIEMYEIPKHSDLKQIVPQGVPYFYAELPSGEKLLHRMKSGFPLQFGREALAHETLLNMPERADWRSCKISRDEEVAMTRAFREEFKEYDPNAI